jgi:DNA replication protein DnaD
MGVADKKSKGFIALYRSIQDHWIWQDDVFSRGQAWIDLLLLANYSENKALMDGQLVKVERGEHITSIRKLSERWRWSRTKTKAFLDLLQEDQMIKYKSDTKKTVVKVLNYDLWQGLQDDESATEKPQGSHRNLPKDEKKSMASQVLSTKTHEKSARQKTGSNSHEIGVYNENESGEKATEMPQKDRRSATEKPQKDIRETQTTMINNENNVNNNINTINNNSLIKGEEKSEPAAFVILPTKDGDGYKVTYDDLDSLQKDFPYINPFATILGLATWMEKNPDKIQPMKNMQGLIKNWFKREYRNTNI